MLTPLHPDELADRIVIVRGRRVMLDVNLAAVYGVEPKRLNEQVKRDRTRFPDDFLFELTLDEAHAVRALRSRIATIKPGQSTRRGQHLKYAPNAFTEHGAVMLAAVLNSPVAIEASIQVVRAFVRLRSMAATHQELAQKLEALESKFDHQFGIVFDAIRQLMKPAASPTRIGFRNATDSPTHAEGGEEP